MKIGISDYLRRLAQAPADVDPDDLYAQLAPALRSMNLHNLIDRKLTALETGVPDNKGNAVYIAYLRRNSPIEDDQIKRISREADNFDRMVWTNKGIAIYIRYPYKTPVAAPAPAAP